MSDRAEQAGRVHWIAVVAIAVLVLGVALAYQQSRVPRGPVPAAPSKEPEGPVIEQALRQAAPIDSAEYKQRWIDEVRGADLAGLDTTRIEVFLRFANAQQCTCGCGYTLAGCRESDMTCGVSGPRIQALLDSVRAGQIAHARGIRARRAGG